jgi:hypothetical protein
MSEPTPQPNPDADRELDALFALARTRRPDTSRAEFGFETRLMARVRSRRDASSVWAMVTWRFIPFLAACVIGLTIWQAQDASDTSVAAGLARLNDPADVWSN